MKQVYAVVPYRILVFLFLTIFMANGAATYFVVDMISNITRLASVIVLLTIYFTIHVRMANVFLTILIFYLIGDSFYVFNLGDLSNKLSTTFYLGGYSLLTFVLLGKFKRMKYEGLVSLYLVVVLMLNAYFLYVLYGIIKENFTDEAYLMLSMCHGIILLVMTFFAFAVYLSQETTQSIIFLIMVFSFVFSDVLYYICNLYVYYWVFEFISNMLHLVGLILLFAYVYNHHKIVKVKLEKKPANYLDLVVPTEFQRNYTMMETPSADLFFSKSK